MFKILKYYWEAIKLDIFSFIKNFEVVGQISNGCSISFIYLIPKCKDNIFLKDHKPVNLIRCMYKILSKTLSIRLKIFIGKVISPKQSAYIEGRSILDGPLVLNELLSWANKAKEKILSYLQS